MKTRISPVASLEFVQDVLSGLNVRENNYLATPAQAAQTYRVVAQTQIYENYGAHAWEGEGECPQYWKAKGGNEYILAENLSEYDILTVDIRDFVPAEITRDSDYYREYLLSVEFIPHGQDTCDEQMYREMVAEGYYTQEQADIYLRGNRRFLSK